jgi:hypothetical protein
MKQGVFAECEESLYFEYFGEFEFIFVTNLVYASEDQAGRF